MRHRPGSVRVRGEACTRVERMHDEGRDITVSGKKEGLWSVFYASVV